MFVSVMTISLICIYSNYLSINNYYNSQLGTTGKMCVFQGRIMKRCQQPPLLLWLTAVVAVNALGSHAAEYDKLVGKVIFFPILVLLSCHSHRQRKIFFCWQSDPALSVFFSDCLSILITVHPSIANQQVKTNKPLQVIPHSGNSSNVTILVFEGSMITLNKEDRLALASYPRLEELHLDDNQVTSIPANYFSVVPLLRVLSLSENKISR